ncbi:hypothetical protein [Taibaiella helva]|uniref:hypothetical protein n=1 Tax=Taibaiella helva TaxID=2301235 RepID=UPI00130071BF|nr:hypothetical protein [Taibaiella helva]
MFYGFLILFALVAGFIYAISNIGKKTKRIAALKLHYEQLLKSGDKPAALVAGRAYYSALRDGKMLTMYDEQAITNDLSTMS